MYQENSSHVVCLTTINYKQELKFKCDRNVNDIKIEYIEANLLHSKLVLNHKITNEHDLCFQ